MSEEIPAVFLEGLQQLGLDPHNQPMLDAFLHYRRELLDWNTRFNLTAITDPTEVLLKHFLDSLTLLQAIDQPNARLLDIGSGAGFPGLPLKIARPDWHVTLMEATGKKTTFLRHIIETLQLQNSEVIHGRAEELAQQRPYRGAFNIVTARAVSALPTLLEYCAPYCRVGGLIILPKKGDLTEELDHGKQAALHLGTRFKADLPVTVPALADGRRLFVWQQQKPCPPQYPRSGSAMAKKPLG